MNRNLCIVALIFLVIAMLVACNNDEKTKQTTMKETANIDLKALLAEPKHYVCYRTDEPITINGKLEEKSWQQAEWTDLFTDIEGDAKPKPNQDTKVKMLWDDDYLYIAAQLDEEHIWAYLENHDEIVYFENDFEIFIDPDNDALNYFEFEINAKQTVFDLFLPHPYRHSSFALHSWDFKGVKYAVNIEGTLNDGSDKDKRWTVEVAIPFTDLAFKLDSGKPDTEKPWRINFSRVQWDTKWENGKYVKLTAADGKPLPEHNWVWSPVGVISMHMPERYGYLKFSNTLVGVNKEEFSLSPAEKLKSVLWAVFYRQEKFFEKNKKFANTMEELGNDINSLYDTKAYTLTLIAGDTIYESKLESSDGKVKMYITNEGVVKEK